MKNKLKHAVIQRDEQVAAFNDFHEALPQAETKKWTEAVEAWENDPTKPNPFVVHREGLSPNWLP